MDRKIARRTLLEILGTHDVLAILYGSQVSDHDIDVLLIQRETVPTPTILFGRFDVLAISNKQLANLCEVLCPLVTEPILTGELLFGDETRWCSLQNTIRSAKPTSASVTDACKRCIEAYQLADHLMSQSSNDEGSELLRWALQNLSFSIAYSSFARAYSIEGAQPCTLKELIKDHAVRLPDFWEFRQKAKRKVDLSHHEVHYWLERWRYALVGIE